MRRAGSCGYLCPCEGLGATLRDLRRLTRILAHPQHAIDLSTFLYQQAFGMHVAVNDARRLKLDALLRIDGTAYVAANDGLTTHHIALHFPAPGDQHLLRRA